MTHNLYGVHLEGEPRDCPFCHFHMQQNLISSHQDQHHPENFYVLTQCSNLQCSKMYISHYQKFTNTISFKKVMNGTPLEKEFSEVINKNFESFVSIYNQAFAAEQNGLKDICGMGFRKALEFLIKDYIIKIKPEEEDKVKSLLLGKCIDSYIDSEKIKEISKRAAWLGNDETHYVKKWENKDVSDLKKLIDITVFYIEYDLKSDQYIEEMPAS